MMRKIKGYTSYSYAWGQRRKSWWHSWRLWLGLFLPMALLSAELILRGGLWLFKADSWLETGEQPVTISSVYGFGDRGLQVTPHQGLGYVLAPNQSSPFWQINDRGFRSDGTIKETPETGETRLFLLGNSTAFGYGAESNGQTIGQEIEKFLNQKVERQRQELTRRAGEFNEFNPPPTPTTIKDTRFRVITAAVPGYSSGNSLFQLAHKIMAFRPDGLILLEGYEDLRLASPKTISTLSDPDPILVNPTAYLWQELGRNLSRWWQDLYLVRLSRKLAGLPPPPTPPAPYQTFSSSQFSSDPREVTARIERLLHHWQQIIHLTERSSIKTLILLQPEITTKPPSPSEAALLEQMGTSYRDRLQLSYQTLKTISASRPKLKFLNPSTLYQNFKETAFIDPIHLTPAANRLLAQTIADQTALLFPPEIRKSE